MYIAKMTSMLRAFGRATALIGFGAALLSPLAAEELSFDEGIFIDMPSGFAPGEGDDKTRFSYLSPDGEIEFDILIQKPG
jgi:hypothetical protein